MGGRSALPALIPLGWQDRRGVGRLAWLVLSLFASIAGITAARAGDAPPPPLGLEDRAVAPRVEINWCDGRLSVRAHASPWEEMLPVLERYIGIPIRVKGPLAGTLTQEFESLPLEQGLRRLFRVMNTVFFYAPHPSAGASVARLAQVWLIPRDDGVTPRPPSSSVRAAAAKPHGDPNPLVEEMGPHQQEAPPTGEEEVEEEEEAMAERR
jgi:hypothetical protein